MPEGLLWQRVQPRDCIDRYQKPSHCMGSALDPYVNILDYYLIEQFASPIGGDLSVVD